jgi:signal transduction histidine kinase
MVTQEANVIGGDTTETMRVVTRDLRGEGQMSGNLSIFLQLDSTSGFSGDTLMGLHASGKVLEVLERLMDEEMARQSLPVQWRVIRAIEADSTKAMEVGSYQDVATCERYVAEVFDYKADIWWGMWPQVLFSGLLFGLMALAFGLIYRSMRQQERLAKLKNDFVSNMTHELKTPIATVNVAIEALQRFDALQNPARSQEYLEISRQELGRLSLLVDKVLRMSQFEGASPELKPELFNLRDLVQEILETLKLQFEKLGASVRLSDADDDFSLRADRLHIASVVFNLIDNALKYSPNPPEIDIELQEQASDCIVRVRDKGIGIPAEYLDKVFDRFFRVPNGDVHNVKGHGLGLSYVAAVVRQHGGRIDIESKHGQGTEVCIRLPKNLPASYA